VTFTRDGFVGRLSVIMLCGVLEPQTFTCCYFTLFLVCALVFSGNFRSFLFTAWSVDCFSLLSIVVLLNDAGMDRLIVKSIDKVGPSIGASGSRLSSLLDQAYRFG
jgi:hypothetical protein